MIQVLFWTLETIIFGAGLASILMVYDVLPTSESFQFVYSGCFIFVSFVSLIFVCEAFRRLRKCLEHDQVGISSKQIIIHISIFSLSLLAMTSSAYVFFTFGQ